MELIDFSWTPIIFPFSAGVFLYKCLNVKLKYVFFFVSYGVANELTVFALRHLMDIKNTMPSSNLYTLVSFLLIALFYRKILAGLLNEKWIFVIICLFEIFSLIYIIFFQGILSSPVFPRAVGAILIVFFSILYFYRVMIEAEINKLWNEPLVWINLAFLIYYSGNLFYYILFNIVLEYSREFLKIILMYFSVLNTLFYVLMGIGFLKVKHKIQG